MKSIEPRTELDLRQLEPPAPLYRALEALRCLQRNHLLLIHTRFKPVHLLEQLESMSFEFDTEELSEQHWLTSVWRASSPASVNPVSPL
ncbi:MAG: DUF2249 domain-containing protein [Verrucomicrobia bacterium]|nr:DUF2249 domain-containing protein [Verrucomicrobiota bacterium]